MATATLLELLDGTRGLPLLREEGRKVGLPDGHVDGLVERLAAAGLLDDATGGGPAADQLRRDSGLLDRLRPDLTSLSLIDREPTGGIRRLAARRALRVQVRGAGRVGATIAATLAGAGVGRVDVLDGGCVEPWDVAPGGLPPESIGERRDVSARRLVQRCAPARPPRQVKQQRPCGAPAPGPRGSPPRNAPRRHALGEGTGTPAPGTPRRPAPDDCRATAVPVDERAAAVPAGEQAAVIPGHEPGLALVVFAPRDGLAAYAPDPVTAEPFLTAGTPHLYAGVLEGTGVVGPLVLPGASACAGCLDLGRAERDPAWRRLLAQWRSGRYRSVPTCDLALATAVAGFAAAQALAFLDGSFPTSVGARWEAPLPELGWRSEPVPPRVKCGCGAGLQGEREDTSMGSEPHETMSR